MASLGRPVGTDYLMVEVLDRVIHRIAIDHDHAVAPRGQQAVGLQHAFGFVVEAVVGEPVQGLGDGNEIH